MFLLSCHNPVQTPRSRLRLSFGIFYTETMKSLFLLITLFCWTHVQAQSTSSQGVEVTYEELVQELSAKKKSTDDSPTQVWVFDRVQAIFGYTFSSIDYSLPSGGTSFLMSGIDVRMNGQMRNSTWQLEGGFKNLSKSYTGNKSAEDKILTTSLKNQDYVTQSLQYVAGLSSSLHLIDSHGSFGSKNELDMSLNVTGGLRGPLSSSLSWGVDLNAYSPISGKLLKSGIEATVLLSSTL